MELEYHGRNPGTAPLLAGVYDADKLYELARNPAPAARADLARVVAAILEKGVSPRESELVADVLIGLMRQAEKDLRQALSEQLSVMDNVPLRLVLQLANDDIEIARPVLMQSTVLGDMDLIYIIKSKPASYWQAIATRQALGDQVINILVETRDFDTAVALAENEGITLTERAITVLSDLAQGHDALAAPLLRRDETTPDVAAQLYNFVGQQIKQFILQNYDVDTGAILRAVDRTVQEFSVEVKSDETMCPEGYMVRAAEELMEKELLTVKLMLETLRCGHLRSFIAQFSVFTGLPSKTVGELLRQSHGQGLAVICKAFGVAKHDFVSLFMLTNRVRSMGATVDLKDMTRAIGYYNRISEHMAEEILNTSIRVQNHVH
ncbi:MAG: DUF2336 domain-containing protein [Alphaproteobacteria bacterium]|nr:DUF2336 domain-containing protein [Alphaproteobacteria bacterium]